MDLPPTKEYGLIIPNKNKLLTKPVAAITKPSIFASDSDSDDNGSKPTGISRGLKREEKVVQAKAVEEDPTIYQYDELYDEMDQKRKDSKLSRKDLDKKPKYISKLLKAAEKRKLENERRIERQVQREREAEGNQYQDKESFVTSGYKKKLEEMKKQEELEKREEYLEAIGDVTKQGNLDGFYRHLYEQKVNYDEDKEKKMEDIKTAVEQEQNTNDEKESGDDKTERDDNCSKKGGNKRQYRKKQDSKSEESEDEINKEPTHLPSNLDADSDFSIDSDSESDSDGEPKQKIVKKEDKDTVVDKENINGKKVIDEKGGVQEDNGNVDSGLEVKDEKGINSESAAKVEEEIKIQKPKIDIWKKRTVGEIYDAALQRYFERKTMREG